MFVLSVQGSHIMQEAGTYVLQWHNQDDQTEFLPSISSHKAQLMYFYETLPSIHYRYVLLNKLTYVHLYKYIIYTVIISMQIHIICFLGDL